jgi:hypothetical protein
MNQNSVGNRTLAAALKGLVEAFGHGTFFHESTVAIQAAKAGLPANATNTEIKAVVWKFIKTENNAFFTQVFIPVLEEVIPVILDIALLWLTTQNPAAGAVAGAVVHGVETQIKENK